MISFTRSNNLLAAFLLFSTAAAAFGSSIDYLNLSVQTSAGNAGGNLTYNSTTGQSVTIAPPGTTTYSAPTALGLTSGTIQMSSANGVYPGYTASSLATGNLATGSVGVYAFPSTYIGSPNIGDADSQAIISDSLTFNVAGATSSTVTNIGVTFTVHGTVSNGTYTGGGSALLNDVLSLGLAEIGYSYNYVANNVNQPPTNNIYLNTGWVSENIASESANSFTFTGTYALTGSSDTIPILLELILQCEGDSSCDLSHTGAVTFTLPSNVTFTSASGVFLTASSTPTAVPEPAYTVVLGAALLGIGALARRRNRCASAS